MTSSVPSSWKGNVNHDSSAHRTWRVLATAALLGKVLELVPLCPSCLFKPQPSFPPVALSRPTWSCSPHPSAVPSKKLVLFLTVSVFPAVLSLSVVSLSLVVQTVLRQPQVLYNGVWIWCVHEEVKLRVCLHHHLGVEPHRISFYFMYLMYS